MIRRIALVSGCVALSALAFGGKAHAQSVDVDFNGTVAATCIQSNVTNGTTGMVTTPTPDISKLSSDPTQAATGAVPGRFNLTCNNNASITLNAPVVLPSSNGPDAISAEYSADLKDGGTTIASSSKTGGASAPVAVTGPFTNRPYEVFQYVDNSGAPLRPGTYDYRVNVNIVAN